jgi:hypothetical protein
MKSVKLQAALDLIKVAGIAAGTGIAFALATNLFGIANVMIAGGFIMMAVCFYQLFQIRCSQIEYQRTLKEMVDKTK